MRYRGDYLPSITNNKRLSSKIELITKLDRK